MHSEPEKATVMIVDDTPANLDLLSEMLQSKDIRVIQFPNGPMALKAAKKNPPDLILLDIIMPEMDGFEVCRHLKADERLKEIPVIFISALDDKTNKLKAFSQGGVDYVAKPFQEEEVISRVSVHLKIRRQKRKIEELFKEALKSASLLEAKNQELETFAYSISHDLNEEGREFINNIRQSADQMSQLIDDLLAYSRLERRSWESSAVNIQLLAQSSLAGFVKEVEQRGGSIAIEIPPLTVSIDPEGLAIALRNVVENAIKFTKKEEPPQIEVGFNEKEGGFSLYILDHGIGFDMKCHDRIFGIFNRLHRSDEYEGTGIGLALARKAMERMGGRIWAKSKPKEGSTFYLEIPSPQG